MKLEVDLSESVAKQLEEVAKSVWQDTFKNQLEKEQFPVWMDLETTCRYLQVSRGNLSKFIKNLDFPVSVIAQTKRCNRFLVDEWMNDHKI